MRSDVHPAVFVHGLFGPFHDVLRRVFARHRVHLVAGERSAGGWHVPEWARRAAASSTVIPDAGHMMMLEHPEAFGAAIDTLLRPGATPSLRDAP